MPVPDFLLTEDTCPNQEETAEWWAAFCIALRSWRDGDALQGELAREVSGWLGQPSPVKRWLIALFLKKVELLETWKLC